MHLIVHLTSQMFVGRIQTQMFKVHIQMQMHKNIMEAFECAFKCSTNLVGINVSERWPVYAPFSLDTVVSHQTSHSNSRYTKYHGFVRKTAHVYIRKHRGIDRDGSTTYTPN